MRTDLSIDGWHGELHVAVGDVGLAVVKATSTKELLADGRESPIAAYNQIGLDPLLRPIGPERES